MSRMLQFACVLAVPAVLLVSACGGSDGDGASEEDFLAEVDALCGDTAIEVGELYASEGTPSSIEDLRAFVPKRLAISEQAQSKAEAIDPPDELEDDYEEYLADRRAFIALLAEQKRAAEQGEARRADQLEVAISDAGDALAESAEGLGLEVCAGKPPEDQRDFVASADAVCIERAERIRDQFNAVPNPTTAQDYADLLPGRVPIEEDTVERLEAIEAPDEISELYASYVDKERRVAAGYQDALDAANRVDTPAFEQANRRLEGLELEAARSASDVGLEGCANQLPDDEAADLKATIEDIWTDADPAHCSEDYTSAFVDELGGQEACEGGEVPAGEANSVEISNLGGTTGVMASADVIIHGGTHDGEENHEFFEYGDGRWKLDQVVVSKQPSP